MSDALRENAAYRNLLIACLKRDKDAAQTGLAAFSPEQWRDFLALAADQRVTSLVWHRIKQMGLDVAVPDEPAGRFRDALSSNTMRNLRLNGEMRFLLSALETVGIPLILLKGIVMANAVYEHIGLREMNDIDVLARPADLMRVANILIEKGYSPLQPMNPETVMQAGHHLPGIAKKGYANFELHWSLTNPPDPFHISPEELWDRAVPVTISGGNALMLSPEDMLLHLCLHTSYQHSFAFGLRPSCDIAEMIDRFGSALNWANIVKRACDRNWQKGTYLALQLASDLTGAAVPRDVLKSLRPHDLPRPMLATARNQVFTEKKFAISVPVPFAQLLESRSIHRKIGIFWRRVFLSKAIISTIYGVSMKSWRIYACYPRRFRDVLRRHRHTLKKYNQNDAALKTLTEQKSRLADWLTGPQDNHTAK